MSKLNWSRAGDRSLDPARYQRRFDFVTPDEVEISKGKKRRRIRALLSSGSGKRAEKKRKVVAKAIDREAHEKNAAAKAERRALAKQQQQAAVTKRRAKKAAQAAKAAERRAAFAEYQKTPEYAEKLARQEARMAAKKKTHLQDWIERKTDLDQDRLSLREQWRAKLLPKDNHRT